MGFRAVGVLLLCAVAIGWLQRDDIAQSLITDYFEDQGVSATYDVALIGPDRQVLTNIIIGDPARPDLTIDRLELNLTARLGLPSVRKLRVTRPRLYGTLADGGLSFGSLDPLIFTDSEQPFTFPDMELIVEDGRGRIASDAGAIGITLRGRGHLRGGFKGELAVLAPRLAAGGCVAQQASLYGNIGIDAERPVFTGPLRFAALECEGSGLSIGASGAQVTLRADRNLADFQGKAQLETGAVALAEDTVAQLAGEGAFTWRSGALTARYELTASDVATGYMAVGEIGVTGKMRADKGFARLTLEGEANGQRIVPGAAIGNTLAKAQTAAAGTLLEPLIARFQGALAQEMRASTLTANFSARSDGSGNMALIVPEARWEAGSGETLLALSRVQIATASEGLPRFDGNFATGGVNMPRITGRMEQRRGSYLALQLAMQEYRAGDARLAIPQLAIRPGDGNTFVINGLAEASGAIAGGMVEHLRVPLDAKISPAGALSMWEGCRRLEFDRLTIADFALGRQALALCPLGSGPMLRNGPNGLRFAARTGRLDLAASYGESPLTIASGPLTIAYPGTITAPGLQVALGSGAEAMRFSASEVTADLAGGVVAGRFAGMEALLPAIPLDITKASGAWSFADGTLNIDDGAFTLTDRVQPARFNPLISQDARLRMADAIITAEARMLAPFTGAEVVQAAIVHNLANGIGGADLAVRGLTFTGDLQPYDLTETARGVVANVVGTVTGTGRIDWSREAITSTGTFSTQSLDFAAAFGPVKGASGTIRFTDLLEMTTAPNQRFKLAAINPGIEVYDGEVGISIISGTLVRFEGGRWPLLGGTMVMRPVDINVGAIEERTYLIEIEGLQANQFIERMNLNNLAANGVFDGSIPIVFDAEGNGRLEGGVLASRAPGGNLAYVGELTYEDMGIFANYAFSALRDLSYRRMEIVMNGPLTGELVTNVRFDGIGQGETAQSNIVTRQIARLPIELHINIRAPFYQLMSSTRSLYDPSAVRDPRSLGLFRGDGRRFVPAVPREEPPKLPPQLQGAADQLRNEPKVQLSESETGL